LVSPPMLHGPPLLLATGTLNVERMLHRRRRQLSADRHIDVFKRDEQKVQAFFFIDP